MSERSTVRERTEELERASLSTWATLAVESKGRDRFEDPDALRTAFQQDRDRLLHCHAFRRLRDKTHSFIPAQVDVELLRYRVRLTHTLEVAQIARTVARALRLNEDLVEAIAYGHDLGHTAFGPAGEEALAVFSEPPFRHHEQSLRVVERLERDGRGLNLTFEVRDGILNHPWSMPPAATVEGQLVQVANRVAALAYDLQDALTSRVIEARDLPAEVAGVLGQAHGERVGTVVSDIVACSTSQPQIRMSPRVEHALEALRRMLDERVHQRAEALGERDRAIHCLRSLVLYYSERPSRLPSVDLDEPLDLQVVDYVASLGDVAALRLFSGAFLPRG